MGFIWTLIIGLVAGAIAKFFMPGPDPGGIIITMLLGVAGAFLATWLGRPSVGTTGRRGRRADRRRGRRGDHPDRLSDVAPQRHLSGPRLARRPAHPGVNRA